MIPNRVAAPIPHRGGRGVALLDATRTRGMLGGGTMLVPSLTRGERDLAPRDRLRRLGFGFRDWSRADSWAHRRRCHLRSLSSPARARIAALPQARLAAVWHHRRPNNSVPRARSAAPRLRQPSSEVPAVLVAVDATMHVHGPRGGPHHPGCRVLPRRVTVDLRPASC